VQVESVADVIDRSRLAGTTLDSSTVRVDDLATGYAVQHALTARRIARGASVVGWKLGYTTQAMRDQLGIAEPNYGPLLSPMLLAHGAEVPEGVLHPRVEPEIALVLGREVGTALDADEALAACDEAIAALEVVDSVWSDYRFDLEHNTADGSSAAYVVRGAALPLDVLAEVEVTLYRNGGVVGSGTGAAAMGHPARALAWLTAELDARGLGLHPGDIVITGGLCAAVPIEQGDVVHAEFEHPSSSTRRVAVRR
jgi:2-keto-4-pentenoate hydratase